MSAKYYPALTGIRAIAAFMIVAHHSFAEWIENDYLLSALREFNVGVNIFFVLSGFLIWHIYSAEYNPTRNWLKRYIVYRIARIFPVYILLSVIAIVAAHFTMNYSIEKSITLFLINISFLSGYSSEVVYLIIPQGWSLCIEMLFYASVPLMFHLLYIKKINLAKQGMAIIFTGIVLYGIFSYLDIYGIMNNLRYVRITTYFGRFTEFFYGIGLAMFLNKKTYINPNSCKFTLVGALFILLSIFLFLPLFQQSEIQYSIQSIGGFIFNVTVLPVFICSLFLGLIKEKTIIQRILSSKLFIILGNSSFALYFVHYGIANYLIRNYIANNVLVELLFIYIISIIFWRFYEEPMNLWIKNVFRVNKEIWFLKRE